MKPKSTQPEPQWFVKFFGSSTNRASRNLSIFDEVKRSGNHLACTYPKRPRKVRDGAVMYMGRLVSDENDILIYGRAIGKKHDPFHDNATPADLEVRPWKSRWPHYIRVDDVAFIDGSLSDGVSLKQLMDTLDWQAFASTTRNHAEGKGNENPRKSIRQQAAVELTAEGAAWIAEKLEAAFGRLGTLTSSSFDGVK